MAFLNETGLATFLGYLKAWARATFASKTDSQTIEGSTTFSQTITGSVSGNAGTATKLATARTINGVAFDGSANITVADSTKLPLAGGTLTGTLIGTRVITSESFAKKHPNITKGENPSSTRYWTLSFCDKNGTDYASNCLGMLETSLNSSGVVESYIRAVKNTANSSTSARITAVYDTVNNIAYATAPSTPDNPGSSYILTYDWIPKDDRIVHRTGAETISGKKTFNTLSISEYGNLVGTENSNVLYICGGKGSTGAEGSYVILFGSADSSANAGCFFIRAATSTSNVKTLKGQPDGTLTWNGQNIQTSSDERIKTPLSQVPDEVLDAWESIEWGEFRFLDAVERKGASARLHLGLIAQRVKAVFDERGLDACAYGVLCHEEHEATEDSEAVDLWMVRYTEALAMEAACQRRRADRLEARIAALEAANG